MLVGGWEGLILTGYSIKVGCLSIIYPKMDKSWINKPRNTNEYLDGVRDFIKFGMDKSSLNGKISCPCRRCVHKFYLDPQTVEAHLIWNGFLRGYTEWFFHGECMLPISSNQPSSDLGSSNMQDNLVGDDMTGLIRDAFRHGVQNSKRGQTYSNFGKATRAALSIPNTSGSKSYAQVRQEFERATTLIAERVDDSTASTQSSRMEAEVFTELMGSERYDRVRGYGVGVIPTQLSEVSRHTRDAADGVQDTCSQD